MSGPGPAPVPGQPENKAGSPGGGEPAFLLVGLLRKAHGVRGEITMEVITDFPERLRPRRTVYIGEEHLPLQIGSVRWKDTYLLLSFDGYTDCDQVNRFRNELVYVRMADLPALPAGQYYHHQLIGLSVEDSAGQLLGILAEILETGANDVYVVRAEGREELLLPVIAEVVLQVDLEHGKMVVHPPEWE